MGKTCSECGCRISDVYYTLDICKKCSRPVEGKLVKLSGSVYHPQCFSCQTCKISLVGVPFNVDELNNIFCAEDFKKKFAASCSVCRQAILPKRGETAASRL